MEFLLLLTLMTGNIESAKAETKPQSEAAQIIEINEKSFSKKQLMNSPALCAYHNELLKEVGREQIHCARSATPDTKEAEVVKQLQEAEKLSQMTEPSVNDMIVNLPRRK